VHLIRRMSIENALWGAVPVRPHRTGTCV